MQTFQQETPGKTIVQVVDRSEQAQDLEKRKTKPLESGQIRVVHQQEHVLQIQQQLQAPKLFQAPVVAVDSKMLDKV